MSRKRQALTCLALRFCSKGQKNGGLIPVKIGVHQWTDARMEVQSPVSTAHRMQSDHARWQKAWHVMEEDPRPRHERIEDGGCLWAAPVHLDSLTQFACDERCKECPGHLLR